MGGKMEYRQQFLGLNERAKRLTRLIADLKEMRDKHQINPNLIKGFEKSLKEIQERIAKEKIERKCRRRSLKYGKTKTRSS